MTFSFLSKMQKYFHFPFFPYFSNGSRGDKEVEEKSMNQKETQETHVVPNEIEKSHKNETGRKRFYFSCFKK